MKPLRVQVRKTVYRDQKGYLVLSNLGYAYLLTIYGKNYQVYTREDIINTINAVVKGA